MSELTTSRFCITSQPPIQTICITMFRWVNLLVLISLNQTFDLILPQLFQKSSILISTFIWDFAYFTRLLKRWQSSEHWVRRFPCSIIIISHWSPGSSIKSYTKLGRYLASPHPPPPFWKNLIDLTLDSHHDHLNRARLNSACDLRLG